MVAPAQCLRARWPPGRMEQILGTALTHKGLPSVSAYVAVGVTRARLAFTLGGSPERLGEAAAAAASTLNVIELGVKAIQPTVWAPAYQRFAKMV